jgi:hypothetical protein
MSAWNKFIVASDLHGDKQDPSAVRVLAGFIAAFQPDIRVFAGDLWDFRSIRKGAGEEERRESMSEDFDAGMAWLEQFRPQHFLLGNHDQRLYDLAENDNGVVSDYAAKGVLDIEAACRKQKTKILPYHKRNGILKLGNLKILHGFHCGIYASRQTALVYGSALFGHTHVIDQHAVGGLDRRVARNIGCLCALDMGYNSRNPNTLRQAHGFAYGVLNERTGDFHVWQAEGIEGKWVLPSDIVEFK